MNTSTPKVIEVKRDGQTWKTNSQEDLEAWKVQEHARREALGHNKPVSDDEALEILGLL